MLSVVKSAILVLAVTATGGLTSVPSFDAPGQDFSAQSFAVSCQRTLSQNDFDFAAGISIAEGCGCFANALGEKENMDFRATSVLLREIIATEANQEPDWSSIATKAGVDQLTLGQLLQSTQSAIGICL
ncbi:hypothetical protein [Yoonia sp. BS5-3]|uniref:Rap1a immunity protein domain-containing protein n=1 Tax=Yoonia phaeophyticola TaxID=3137369 RepID=A0ABZ2V1S9_9RHOB